MTAPIRPSYLVEVRQDGPWWIGQVIAVGLAARRQPLNAVTQSSTYDGIEPMVRDLIATILDVPETAFDVEYFYHP